MLLAKEYGCLPQDIENMDAFWYDRMLALLKAENAHHQRQMEPLKKKKR